MDYEKEIPFGAFDSELMYQEIFIPEGFEATIVGDKIILKKTESDDEKIRKAILELVKQSSEILDEQNQNNMIAWLEKQKSVGEIVERCKNSWYNEGKIAGMAEGLTDDEKYQQGWHDALEKQVPEPNWCHHKVDLSDCSEEYRKAYYDGWNNCNMQHSQCKSELDDVLKCLINGMKFYYEDNKDATWGTDKWSMPVKHIIEVLEKQGEKPTEKQKEIDYAEEIKKCKDNPLYFFDKYVKIKLKEQKPIIVEPKFKVGDWITDGEAVFHITSYDIDYGYQLETQKGTSFHFSDEKVKNKYHLWTIDDAKDGDVLACGDKVTDCPFIFHNLTEELNPRSYCGINTLGHFQDNDENGGFWCKSYEVRPATKEQRDTLERAMTNAGYRWNKEELKLEKI